MKKWVIGAIVVAVLVVGVIIRIPWNPYESAQPEVELAVQDQSSEGIAPPEPLGPEVDPFPSEGWTWVERPSWPDWVKFYRNKVLFTRTSVIVDFAHADDITSTGEGESYQTSPYNIPVLIGDGKGLALVRLISFWEGPSEASAVFYDPSGNIIGQCDDLLGDLPTFDPTGRYFFVEYCDGEGGEIGPIRFFRWDGAKLFDLNEEDVDRDLHRVIPWFKGTGHLSMFTESGFVGFSEKRPELFGVVVITVDPDRVWNGSIGSDEGPTFMLVYNTKGSLLGAVRLRYLKSDVIEKLAKRALSDPTLIAPKGASAPFLTEICDPKTGLLRRSDGTMCYRTTPNEKSLAGLRLGSSTVATLESLLGKAPEVECQPIQKNEGGSMFWRHRWVYRAAAAGGTLVVEFIAQADSAGLQPQDSVQLESVFIRGSGFDSKAGIQVGDTVWKIDEFYGLAYQGDQPERSYMDFIIENGIIVGIHLHFLREARTS